MVYVLVSDDDYWQNDGRISLVSKNEHILRPLLIYYSYRIPSLITACRYKRCAVISEGAVISEIYFFSGKRYNGMPL